jgi:hypothetical membrane protein
MRRTDDTVMVSRALLVLPLAAVAFFVACWVAAAQMFPAWHFFDEWPSTLGTASSPGQLVFNCGMVVSGLACSYYAFRMHDLNANIWYRLGFLLMSISGVTLAGIGIFNDDIPFLHEFCTMSTFTIYLISVLYLGAFAAMCGHGIEGIVAIFSVAFISLSGLFVPLQGWDTMGCCYIDLMTVLIGIIVMRYRIWENDIPPFAPLEVGPCSR